MRPAEPTCVGVNTDRPKFVPKQNSDVLEETQIGWKMEDGRGGGFGGAPVLHHRDERLFAHAQPLARHGPRHIDREADSLWQGSL